MDVHPEVLDALPVPAPANIEGLGSQAALFDDPDALLVMEAGQLRALAVAVGAQAAGMLAEMRRCFGLLAWAGWHRFSSKECTAFVAALAGDAGVSPRTVERWRDAQIKNCGLSIPAPAQARKPPRARKTAGQRATSDKMSEESGPRVIPADSQEAPARKSEADVSDQSSEGVSPRRVGPTSEGRASAAAPESHGSPDGRASSGRSPGEGGQPADSSGRHGSPSPDAIPADRAGFDDRAGLAWLQSKTDQQVRALGPPWRPTIETEIRRWAQALGILPPINLTRPTDLTNREATVTEAPRPFQTLIPMVRPSHDPSCSCFMCRPAPKVAKG